MKTKLCLLVLIIIMSLMIPNMVNGATDEPTVTLDKTSSVRQGDTVTATVSYPTTNTSGIYFNIRFETDAFEISSVNAYNKENVEVRISGDKYSKVETKENYDKYKVMAQITNSDIKTVNVVLKAKKDITTSTNIFVGNIASTSYVFNNDKGTQTKRFTITALPVEPEPQPEPEPQVTPDPTYTPSTTPAEKDDTPTTGSVDVALIATVIAMVSVAGIVAVKKYNK